MVFIFRLPSHSITVLLQAPGHTWQHTCTAASERYPLRRLDLSQPYPDIRKLLFYLGNAEMGIFITASQSKHLKRF
jgi:hypothetical protein